MKKLLFILLIFLIKHQALLASPYNGQIQQFKQPDGTTVDVRLYGNEFYMRGEGLDGYTLVRDKATGWLCYAGLSADKTSFVSTGIVYKGIAADPSTLRNNLSMPKHLDIPDESRILITEQNTVLLKGGSVKAGKNNANKTTSGPIAGNITGLCIVVDFPDEPGTLPLSEYNDFCNDMNYSTAGNNGSLRTYFHDISGGLLDYTNVVYGYYHAPLPFSQYDAMPYGNGINQIMGDAFVWIQSQGFDFSTLSTNPDGSIKAINVIYTGYPQNWAQGMWHHMGGYSGPAFTDNGVFPSSYNCSPGNAPLYLSTIAHENGHMIGGWPDTYKYNGFAGPDGLGTFDLMCSPGNPPNPVPPNPFFRSQAGWGRVMDITNYNGCHIDTANSMVSYKYDNPNNPDEFFLLENRIKKGRSADLPHEGLTVWHIDRAGDNQTTHHQVWLEHANNDFYIQDSACYRVGINTEYSYSTTPSSNFYDGTPSGLRVWGIGDTSMYMTYRLGLSPYVDATFAGMSGDTDGDGFLEKGESANLNIDVSNAGTLSSPSSTINCIATGPYASFITINTPPVNQGIINIGQAVPLSFNVSVAPNAWIGSVIDFKFSITTDDCSIDTIVQSITIGQVVVMDNNSVTACDGIFYDDSGEGDYQLGKDYTKTIYPSPGNRIEVGFLQFAVEGSQNCSEDYLSIYNGPNTSSPLMGTYCNANPPTVFFSTDPSGALTFVFHSDSVVESQGWLALISCLTVTDVRANKKAEFSLFPNPSSGTFNIALNNMCDVELTLTDVVGKEIYSDALQKVSGTQINLSDHPAGVYFLKVTVGGDAVTKKIVLIKP